jgi:diaminopimelate epimerase
MQSILFSKMHGLGNDFVVINAMSHPIQLSLNQIQHIADRHLGIGCDQILIIEKTPPAQFVCRIFNADGSEAEQCGNGLRCVAQFLYDKKLAVKNTFSIATTAGIFDVQIRDDHLIEIVMGAPCFTPKKIPFITDAAKNIYELQLDQLATCINLSVLSMGNPHAVLEVNSIDTFPVSKMGAEIASHPAFPQSTNVGFMEIINRQHIRLRTFERGAGETFACGSNACAAVVAGIKNGVLDHLVKVSLMYGDLWIEWLGNNSTVKMTGPATTVFEGEIIL